jgi:hypothetical protein
LLEAHPLLLEARELPEFTNEQKNTKPVSISKCFINSGPFHGILIRLALNIKEVAAQFSFHA